MEKSRMRNIKWSHPVFLIVGLSGIFISIYIVGFFGSDLPNTVSGLAGFGLLSRYLKARNILRKYVIIMTVLFILFLAAYYFEYERQAYVSKELNTNLTSGLENCNLPNIESGNDECKSLLAVNIHNICDYYGNYDSDVSKRQNFCTRINLQADMFQNTCFRTIDKQLGFCRIRTPEFGVMNSSLCNTIDNESIKTNCIYSIFEVQGNLSAYCEKKSEIINNEFYDIYNIAKEKAVQICYFNLLLITDNMTFCARAGEYAPLACFEK